MIAGMLAAGALGALMLAIGFKAGRMASEREITLEREKVIALIPPPMTVEEYEKSKALEFERSLATSRLLAEQQLAAKRLECSVDGCTGLAGARCTAGACAKHCSEFCGSAGHRYQS